MTADITAAEKQWFGHPRGLATLFFTEMWERFSYYGMRALLILYMTHSTLRPGLGFSDKHAAAIYGLYTALVYIGGIPGGFLADRFLGHYRAVLIGGVIIACGHFSMAIPGIPFFYTGLVLIIIGTGLLKPNVSTIVGTLYRRDDPRRDSGFSLFYMGINFGAFISPLIVGWLGQKVGWHWGFGAAGVGMVFGLIQYLAGKKYLVPVSEAESTTAKALKSSAPAETSAPLTGTDWARIAAALLLTLFSLIFWAGFEQAGSSLNLFADRATRLTILGYTYPSSWFQSVEAFFVVVFSPVFAWIWIKMGRRDPSSPFKFAMGLAAASLAFVLILPAARYFATTGNRVSPWWLIGVYFLQCIGELLLSPVGLSMVTKLSPPRAVGLMMGFWFFALGMGNYLAGWIAGLLQDMSYLQVFRIAAIAIGIGTVVLFAMIKPIKSLMRGVR